MVGMARTLSLASFLLVLSGCTSLNGSYNSALTVLADKNKDWVSRTSATCGVFWPKSAVEGIAYQHGNPYLKQWGLQRNSAHSGSLFFKPHWTQCYTDAGLSTALANCSEHFGEKCELVFYRPFGMDESTHNTLLPGLLASAHDRQETAKVAKAKAQAEAKLQEETKARAGTCKSFGFVQGTKEHQACMFELYKLQEISEQSRLTRNAITNASERQARVTEQLLEEQRFESGMRMLQQSAEMLGAPNPEITCSFNQISQRVVCN